MLLSIRSEPREKMETHINHCLEEQFIRLPRNICRQFRKNGIIFVEFHDDPYYGREDTSFVTKSAVKRSTNLKFSFLTADVWSPAREITIACIVRSPGQSIFDLFFEYTNI